MSRFANLIRKDLNASKMSVGIVAAIIAISMALTWFNVKMGSWHEASLIVPVGISLAFLPIWFVWQAAQKLNTEWKDDTVYTLQVLPVPGWQVLLSKIVSLWVEYTTLLGVISVGTFIFANPLIGAIGTDTPRLSWILRNLAILYLLSLVLFTVVIVFIQLSFVVSRMIGRFQGLVQIWVWILAINLVSTVGRWLAPLFNWVPRIPMHQIMRLDQLQYLVNVKFFLALNIGALIAVIGLFWLTSYLFDNYLEVN